MPPSKDTMPQSSGSHDNWPGIDFQQIMGQINLYQNSQFGSTSIRSFQRSSLFKDGSFGTQVIVTFN